MATRLYPGTGVAAAISPAVDASWTRNASGFARNKWSTTKDNSALADVSELFGGTATAQVAWRQFVSETLDVPQTIAGTFALICRCQELASTEDAMLAYALRVLSGDGSTVRGTLFIHQDFTQTEFNTAAPNTRLANNTAPETLTSVNGLAGDRLVMEYGIYGQTPTNTSNVLLRFGAPTATADFAYTSGLTTDLVSWAEFSQTITFGTPVSGTGPRAMNFSRRRRAA